MYSQEYINAVDGATSIPVDPVTGRIYDIAREGIGIRQVSSGDGNVTADSFTVERRGVNSTPPPVPGQYHIMVSLMYGFVSQEAITEIGGVINEDVFYYFDIDGDSVGYLTAFGDDASDVRDGLISAINAHSWGFPVTATIESANKVNVIIQDLTVPVTCGISTSIYKSVRYVEFSYNGGAVKQYIVESLSSGTDYPALSSLATSYLYSDLTLAPSGVQNSTDVPGSYIWNDFDPVAEGTTTIEGTPQITLPPPGRCFYHDSMIYFGAPALAAGERVKMIVI
jgi:hypothetical protein